MGGLVIKKVYIPCLQILYKAMGYFLLVDAPTGGLRYALASKPAGAYVENFISNACGSFQRAFSLVKAFRNHIFLIRGIILQLLC